MSRRERIRRALLEHWPVSNQDRFDAAVDAVYATLADAEDEALATLRATGTVRKALGAIEDAARCVLGRPRVSILGFPVETVEGLPPREVRIERPIRVSYGDPP